jgi:hypothetical protein
MSVLSTYLLMQTNGVHYTFGDDVTIVESEKFNNFPSQKGCVDEHIFHRCSPILRVQWYSDNSPIRVIVGISFPGRFPIYLANSIFKVVHAFDGSPIT